jgi:hypothetical protein
VGSQKPLAFDPYSVLKVEYRAKDCKQNGEETVCKQATFTFGAVSSLRSPFNPDAPMTSSFVPPTGSIKPMAVITYRPGQCKPLPFDQHGRYLCKQVSWRPSVPKK